MQIPNYTQISNEFIEAMPELSGAAVKVGLAIFRKTIGWHKEADRISYSQLKKMTGLTTNAIKKAIKQLVDKNFIVQIEGKNGFEYDINVSKNDTDVDKGCQKMTGGVSKSDTKGCQKMTPQKKENKLTKEKESAKIRAAEIQDIYKTQYKQKTGIEPRLSQAHYVLLYKFSFNTYAKNLLEWWFDGNGEWCQYSVGGLVCTDTDNAFRKVWAVKKRKEYRKLENELTELRQYDQTDAVKKDIENVKRKMSELEI